MSNRPDPNHMRLITHSKETKRDFCIDLHLDSMEKLNLFGGDAVPIKGCIRGNHSRFVNHVGWMSWSNFPAELLAIIFTHLQDINDCSFLDLYQCLAVCRSWRKIAKQVWQKNIVPTTPWLLSRFSAPNMVVFNTNLYKCVVTTTNNTKDPSFVCSLPNIGCKLPNIGRKLTNIELLGLSDNSKITCATYDGWLLVRSDIYQQFYIYNPITGVVLWLPPLLFIPFLNYVTFVLSGTSPADPDCIICIRFSWDGEGRFCLPSTTLLAFCKPAVSSSWVLVYDDVEDMIFHRGKFYTIKANGALFVYDDDVINGNTTVRWAKEVIKVAEGVGSIKIATEGSSRGDEAWYRFFYLVESKSGELLMIKRIFGTKIRSTRSFRIFKLDQSHGNDNSNYYCWEEIHSLEKNESLFLGWKESISISVNDNDDHNTYKPNCIYFFDQLFNIHAIGEMDWESVKRGGARGGGCLTAHGMYDLKKHSVVCYKYFEEGDANAVPRGLRHNCLLFAPSKLSNI